ncbi:MAG: PqqD family protein [Gaiellaceae bacterium]
MSTLQLRREALEWREVDGEIVALESRGSVYLSANRSGAFLWRALADGTTRDALVSGLAGEYRIDAELARRDVDRFLAELDEHGLLEL